MREGAQRTRCLGELSGARATRLTVVSARHTGQPLLPPDMTDAELPSRHAAHTQCAGMKTTSNAPPNRLPQQNGVRGVWGRDTPKRGEC